MSFYSDLDRVLDASRNAWAKYDTNEINKLLKNMRRVLKEAQPEVYQYGSTTGSPADVRKNYIAVRAAVNEVIAALSPRAKKGGRKKTGQR